MSSVWLCVLQRRNPAFRGENNSVSVWLIVNLSFGFTSQAKWFDFEAEENEVIVKLQASKCSQRALRCWALILTNQSSEMDSPFPCEKPDQTLALTPRWTPPRRQSEGTALPGSVRNISENQLRLGGMGWNVAVISDVLTAGFLEDVISEVLTGGL